MLRSLKHCWWVLCLAAGLQSASAFTLGGPGEDWQTADLGYELWIHTIYPSPDITYPNGWISAFNPEFSAHPMNLGEGFRWNSPVLYYACDAAFLKHFGDRGLRAVDEAAAVFNNLRNVSSYSADLSEFPLDELRFNSTAAALHLFDLKSCVMELLIERLGLFDSQRWTWCLRDQVLPPGSTCPFYDYGVIQRNFDPVTWQPSSYVNGNLFTYIIQQSCPSAPQFGDAVEFLVDSDGTYNSVLSSPKISQPRRSYYGCFHTGLTRDDIGGLRYLYRSSNINMESTPPNTLSAVTNFNQARLIYTSNLTLFAQQAIVTNAAGLEGLYPGLEIVGSTNWWVTVRTTNLSPYFVNYPFDPVGTPPHVAYLTNITTSVELRYQHTFGNVVTFTPTPGGWVTVPVLTLDPYEGRAFVTLETLVSTNGSSPWNPAGSGFPVTNYFTRTFLTNEVVGDFFILPTNSCGVLVQASVLTNVFATTNLVGSTNAFGLTNSTPPIGGGGGGGTTNTTSPDFVAQYLIQYFTNHVYWGFDVDCFTNTTALTYGIEKVSFVRRDYDSLIGRYFHPITNQYTLTCMTNSTTYQQTVFRVVTRPDIIFSADDLASTFPAVMTVDRTTPAWNTTNVDGTAGIRLLGGPGTIEGPTTIWFNKVGTMRLNSHTLDFSMLDEHTAVVDFTWASYDGTTNFPVIYPDTASIVDLEAQLLMQISPSTIDPAVNGVPYQVIFSGSGGQPPYAWSVAPQSVEVLQSIGLAIAPDGTLSGTPMGPGTYVLVIRMTDAGSRSIDASYLLTISP